MHSFAFVFIFEELMWYLCGPSCRILEENIGAKQNFNFLSIIGLGALMNGHSIKRYQFLEAIHKSGDSPSQLFYEKRWSEYQNVMMVDHDQFSKLIFLISLLWFWSLSAWLKIVLDFQSNFCKKNLPKVPQIQRLLIDGSENFLFCRIFKYPMLNISQ